MRVLILGGTGMAGHVITKYFLNQKHDVTVFGRRNLSFCNTIIGDVMDFKNLKNIIQKNNFDAVINAVGLLNKNAEENKATAILLNTYLPHFLAEITRNTKTKIVHMSTDCVFSGKKSWYMEKDIKDGETFYDRTKALGEIENEKDITFRNSIVGPDMNVEGIGLFNWFMKQKDEIHGYSEVYWTGVTTLVLAKAMEKAIKKNLSGLYQLVNNQKISKYELLQLFNKEFKNSEILIKKDYTKRLDKSLLNTRTDFDFYVPTYEDMIKEMHDWVIENKGIYYYSVKGF